MFIYNIMIRRSLNHINSQVNRFAIDYKICLSQYLTDSHKQLMIEDYKAVLDVLSLTDIYQYNTRTKILGSMFKSWIHNKGYLKLNNNYLKKKDDFISNFGNYIECIEANNNSYNDVVLNMEKYLVMIRESRREYLNYSLGKELRAQYIDTYDYTTDKKYLNELKKVDFDTVTQFLELYQVNDNKFNKLRSKWNKDYIEDMLNENEQLLNNIDGKSLDLQQRTAVIVDEDNNLVVAGAGSGKTLTISAKVKYLVEVKKLKPEEILLISFTKKASDEMKERISSKLGIPIESKTFHKLGLDIISAATKVKPSIFQDLDLVIKDYFKDNIYNDNELLKKLINYYSYYLCIPKDIQECESLGDLYEQTQHFDNETLKSKLFKAQKDDKLITLKDERVKSLEEVMIANFLFLNGIEYEYEKEYEYNTANEHYRQYRPDFYLSDYDIYLEHFGINEHMKTPWLSDIEEEKYIEGIKWKRQLHMDNDTKLLETYSYYNSQGILLIKLEDILKQSGVKFKEVDYQKMYNNFFSSQDDRYFKEFIKLIHTFIGLSKSNNIMHSDYDSLKNIVISNRNLFHRDRTNIFLDIVKPIYEYYEDVLESKNMIDFNDMINNATHIIKSGSYRLPYKYIIVDEFQDISKSRGNLVLEIKKSTNSKLMCVGDDWQSIYRFTGSDISLFTKFKEHYGYTEVMKIEKTYRNSQDLIDIAGKFVMENKKQLPKNLRSDKRNIEPIKLVGYTNGDEVSALSKALDGIVSTYGAENDILLLGRNNYDIDILKNHNGFKIKYRDGYTEVTYNNYPNVDIKYMTVHKSKGLEGSNVVILNARNKLTGFPNQIADDPVLSTLLSNEDNYVYAEERRLFYVALTRTKNSTYILVPDDKTSCFVSELIEKYSANYQCATNNTSIKDNPGCPKCKKGRLVLRTRKDSNKKFLGCSNYPLCDHTINHIQVLNEQIPCPVCGAYMVKRKGKFGEFYGCTNYSTGKVSCENSINIDKFTYY